MKNWLRALRANIAQVSFVFLAFTLMVAVGCLSVGNAVQTGMSSTVAVALDESEKTIRAYLREPKIAFDNIYMAVTGMLDRGESQDALLNYLTQTTDSLRMQTDGVLGFNGVYGFIRDEFVDSIGLNPDPGFIPQQRPWYQLAVRNTQAEYTAPYIDALTGSVVISLAQELYGANGDYYGVLGLDIDITWMMEYAQSLQFVEGGYGMIVNQYFYTVAHPVEEYKNIPMQDLGSDYAQITDLLRKSHEVSGIRIRDVGGSNAIAYFRQLYNGWFIGVIMPVSGYYADLYSTAFALIIPGSVLMLALNVILLRLSKAKLRSDEESRAKSSFLARMSHEIRTPMNAILGMVELLLRKDLPDEARAEAAAIKHAGTNLLSIIGDILDFSKIESNRMEILPGKYRLASLINDVVNIIRVRVDEKPLEFDVSIDEKLPCALEGDEARLRQVLLNLLSNAVKYTREGRVLFSVGGEISGESVMLCFEISDTGIGIREDDLDNLFVEFTQFDAHSNLGVEGTGLGLAISRSLCRMMGGDISVSSKYGQGSTFTARLPQKIIDATPIKHDAHACCGETESSAVGFAAPNARVLIVDDIATNLKVAEGFIAQYKAQADICGSGREAIALIHKNDYDIVFMDHMMPEMDGVETVKIIRAMKDAKYQRLPIVALTANALAGMREMFLQAGFNDYLAKPIEIARLNEIMERLIPAEKREKPAPATHAAPAVPLAQLEIDGLDVQYGLMMSGGSHERYREVLALLCQDAKRRVQMLRQPVEAARLSESVTHVHALKSALASVGAASLSDKAARLEREGNAGNIEAMNAGMGDFLGELESLMADIHAATPAGKSDCPESAAGSDIDRAQLERLRDAILSEDVSETDRLLVSISEGAQSESSKKKIGEIAQYVLLSELGEAAGLINDLLRGE